MSRRSLFAVAGVAAVAGALAFAEPPKDKPAGVGQPGAKQPELTPPPGMSEADMAACMAAATPGKMHEHLTSVVGVWSGKNKMWMGAGTEPMNCECTSTFTTMMDGRFVKCETSGDMPGMGPFNGFGIYGFDNVSQKFQATWIDNCGTGMMTGTGEVSADGKTTTWNYTYNCPIQKKPVAFRQVEKRTGKDTMTMEMYGPDPATGKEYKCMEIAYTRKPGATAAASPTATR